MSISVDSGSGSRKKSGATQDLELNLAPMIDCFMILVSFLLISSSYLTIGVLDTSVNPITNKQQPPDVTIANPIETDEIILTIDAKENRNIVFTVEGGQVLEKSIPGNNRDWDKNLLSSEIEQLKIRWPKLVNITFIADNSVSYGEIVGLVETIKTQLPNVYFGGF